MLVQLKQFLTREEIVQIKTEKEEQQKKDIMEILNIKNQEM